MTQDRQGYMKYNIYSVLPSPFKPGRSPGLIFEKLQGTWLEKDAAIHEDTVLCSWHFLFSIFVC